MTVTNLLLVHSTALTAAHLRLYPSRFTEAMSRSEVTSLQTRRCERQVLDPFKTVSHERVSRSRFVRRAPKVDDRPPVQGSTAQTERPVDRSLQKVVLVSPRGPPADYSFDTSPHGQIRARELMEKVSISIEERHFHSKWTTQWTSSPTRGMSRVLFRWCVGFARRT